MSWYVHFITLVAWCRSSSIKVSVPWVIYVDFWCWRFLLYVPAIHTFAYVFLLCLSNLIVILLFRIIKLLDRHIFSHVLNILSFGCCPTFLNLCCTSWSFILVLMVGNIVIHFFNSPQMLIWCYQTVFVTHYVWLSLFLHIIVRTSLIFSKWFPSAILSVCLNRILI